VRRGRFREDLYFRLNVFPIAASPLRERPEDIPLIAHHFMKGAARRLNIAEPRLTEGDVRRLTRYPWPGNVRELENVIERGAILAVRGRLHLDLSDVDPSPRSREAIAPASPMPMPLTELERRARERAEIEAALAQAGGKVFGPGGAAEMLGLKPTTLASRMKALDVESGAFRARR
jgi:transcriptional regulator with GAF, ATPase, and Fis domain